MKFRNFTPHAICMNDGRIFQSEGIARVSASFTEFDDCGICRQSFGDIQGLPAPEPGTLLIVSAMVMNASSRNDLVAPATGHPETVRDDRGRILSVPGFIGQQ